MSAMTNPKTAPFASVRLAEVARLSEVDPANAHEDAPGFHMVRRHFEIQAFGVNGITADAGEIIVTEHHERDDEENGTDGHEELFTVMTGHAVFTIDGEELDAPAGTLVFVRDPALLRSARATEDGTSILAVGGRPGAAYSSRWENDIDARGG
jgi:mannose-6-phosphate isomerase-like protein (cupin superfamily)